MSGRRRSSAGRFIVALAALVALAAAAYVFGPGAVQRFSHPLRYQPDIAASAASTRLDPYLVAAVINVESSFDAHDVSSRGAVGLMQLMPSTAVEVAHLHAMKETVTSETLKTPGTSIRVGTYYLADLYARYGRMDMALAAYNGGSTNADRWVKKARSTGKRFLDCIDFPATRRYVSGVLTQRDEYRAMYPGAFRGANGT